jgi:hypothetical protein
MTRKAPKDTSKAQDTPHESPAHSAAGKTPSPPREPTASEGNAAPDNEDHRAEGDFSSPPELENFGTNNTGAGSDETGWSEPLVVPPVLEKTSEAPPASPNKTSSSAPPEGPELPSPAKGPAVPPPASFKKPPPAPSAKKVSSRKGAVVTADQLSGAVQAAVAQPTSSRTLALQPVEPRFQSARRSRRRQAGS